jgi:hypothetical protein
LCHQRLIIPIITAFILVVSSRLSFVNPAKPLLFSFSQHHSTVSLWVALSGCVPTVCKSARNSVHFYDAFQTVFIPGRRRLCWIVDHVRKHSRCPAFGSASFAFQGTLNIENRRRQKLPPTNQPNSSVSAINQNHLTFYHHQGDHDH